MRYDIAIISVLALGGLGYVFYRQSQQSSDSAPASDQNGVMADGSVDGSTDASPQPAVSSSDVGSEISTAFDSLVNDVASISFPLTRGFRNNNPGNLRFIANNPFRGQVGQDSGGYGIYDTMANGTRASGKNLANYFNRGLQTVSQIITTWAPSSENDTQAYIVDVAHRLNVDPNEQLDYTSQYAAMLDAIFIHEQGSNPISQDQISQWVNS